MLELTNINILAIWWKSYFKTKRMINWRIVQPSPEMGSEDPKAKLLKATLLQL